MLMSMKCHRCKKEVSSWSAKIEGNVVLCKECYQTVGEPIGTETSRTEDPTNIGIQSSTSSSQTWRKVLKGIGGFFIFIGFAILARASSAGKMEQPEVIAMVVCFLIGGIIGSFGMTKEERENVQ